MSDFTTIGAELLSKRLAEYASMQAEIETDYGDLLVKKAAVEAAMADVNRRRTRLARKRAEAERLLWLEEDRDKRPLSIGEAEFVKTSWVDDETRYVVGRRVERLTVAEENGDLRFNIQNRSPTDAREAAAQDIIIKKTDRAYESWRVRHYAHIERLRLKQEGG
jgi:hypothetical protein